MARTGTIFDFLRKVSDEQVQAELKRLHEEKAAIEAEIVAVEQLRELLAARRQRNGVPAEKESSFPAPEMKQPASVDEEQMNHSPLPQVCVDRLILTPASLPPPASPPDALAVDPPPEKVSKASAPDDWGPEPMSGVRRKTKPDRSILAQQILQVLRAAPGIQCADIARRCCEEYQECYAVLTGRNDLFEQLPNKRWQLLGKGRIEEKHSGT